jgi:hypothetical protein
MEANFYWSGDGGSIAKGFLILWIVHRRNNVSVDFHRVLHGIYLLGAVHDRSGLNHEDIGDFLSTPSNSERLVRLLGVLDDLVQLGLELRNG